MEISGIISAIIVGVIIGALGRLVLPGRQHVGIIWTILVGIIAALLGSYIAQHFNVASTNGVDWIEWIIQVALAAIGIGALDRSRRV
jgi:uncharacterized membrane protein YeaQ/YmgE (transglycosylase-associated protein family)